MVFFSMTVFCVLVALREALERGLSFLNYKYQRDPKNVASVQKAFDFSDEDVQKAQSYSKDGFKFRLISSVVSTLAFLAFLILGGFVYLESLSSRVAVYLGAGLGGVVEGVVFFSLWIILQVVASLGFSAYHTFVMEEKHGFNRTTVGLFLLDTIKGLAVSLVIFALALSAGIYLVSHTQNWWLWLWLLSVLLTLFMVWLGPTIITPLFNKLTPLDSKSELYEKIKALAEKTKFKLGGIFTIDASKRSSHGNAYFTGAFNSKKIVFYDTLIQTLTTPQTVAVMAHELGHFKLNHIRWSVITQMLVNGLQIYVLYLILDNPAIYESFGFSAAKPYLVVFLLLLWQGLFNFIFTPFRSYFSRKHEFEADEFAVRLVSGHKDLEKGLVKMNQESHQLPIFHPLFSRFYLSHPPLTERVEAMAKVSSALKA